MRDLAILEEELRTVEDAMGQSISRYQDPLAERLCRVGVSDQKVEDFVAWRRTISNLIADGSSDENKLAKVTAAESAGLALFAEIITSMKNDEHHGRLLAAQSWWRPRLRACGEHQAIAGANNPSPLAAFTRTLQEAVPRKSRPGTRRSR
jgi:hypothetical protein